MIDLSGIRLLEDCVNFAQRLIQTKSMPREEANLAELIAREMQHLEFDQVWIDEIGNVSGKILGRDQSQGALVLNSHLDHVDPGDPGFWPAPPYSGSIDGDYIIGRGACDIKGPLAVQIYSMAGLLRMGERPRRDVVFTGVVEEEIGGRGAIYWTENLDYPVELIVLGEPSSNQLSLGHRGILQTWITFPGRSVHASVPQSGINPNYSMATFLERLNQMKKGLKEHPILGPTTVAPTIVEVDTTSLNVTPAWTRVLLDFRTATESINGLQAFIKRVAGDLEYNLSDAWASEANVPLANSDETIYGYYTAPDKATVGKVRELVDRGMGWRTSLSSYNFATDGRHFIPCGADIVGYSAGEEKYAHTVDERISISMMADSLRGHIQLLREF
jgi:acetylornithine deacetylase/succinyl-diaminopimelate desuccinylase-like protein